MKNLKNIFITAIAVLVISSCSQSNKPVAPESVGLSSDTLALALEKMQSYIDEGKHAGIAVMVMKNNKLVLKESFGYADIENGRVLETDAVFRIFSMSKPVTAVALMTLYDEGKFQLDDKVAKYIPEFEWAMVYSPELGSHFLEFQNEDMTIRNLLTHTAGMSYGWSPTHFVDSLYRAYGIGGWDAPIGEKVKALAQMPLKSHPGTKYEYSLSIDVAGYLVEVLSGMPLDEYFQKAVFDPLKMKESGFYAKGDDTLRLAEVYRPSAEGGLVKLADAWGSSFKKPTIHFSGGAGLVSTLHDYSRFCSMLLNGGELDGVRILEEETVKLIMSDQLPEGVKYRDGYGYGFAGEVNLTTGEYGWSGAASTKFYVDPENEMIVLAFAQQMPSNYDFAREFRAIVGRAVIR